MLGVYHLTKLQPDKLIPQTFASCMRNKQPEHTSTVGHISCMIYSTSRSEAKVSTKKHHQTFHQRLFKLTRKSKQRQQNRLP